MAKNEIHLVHNETGGWDIKRAGNHENHEVVIHKDTKEEAEKAGRELSRTEEAEFVIHGMDGKIQRQDSHGHDSEYRKG